MTTTQYLDHTLEYLGKNAHGVSIVRISGPACNENVHQGNEFLRVAGRIKRAAAYARMEAAAAKAVA